MAALQLALSYWEFLSLDRWQKAVPLILKILQYLFFRFLPRFVIHMAIICGQKFSNPQPIRCFEIQFRNGFRRFIPPILLFGFMPRCLYFYLSVIISVFPIHNVCFTAYFSSQE